ncbi:MAG: hypothetical protein OEW84_02775, partial [Aigarchaeota archaeon]|nr:hypothetical protein [Aigarchaeota archaeon]
GRALYLFEHISQDLELHSCTLASYTTVSLYLSIRPLESRSMKRKTHRSAGSGIRDEAAIRRTEM